ncbi:hypothetical protein [Actinomyces faecalis]|uniref:hypothetical protein n=1 Tax=Actinomyces faecalis TaxID=2722820 RepID=UPI001553CDB7|nr:hypothetical protein [Actinomyces faecalis]
MTDTTTATTTATDTGDADLTALAASWEESQVPDGELTRPGTDPREDEGADVPQDAQVDTGEEEQA